jgi:hypothetical protein
LAASNSTELAKAVKDTARKCDGRSGANVREVEELTPVQRELLASTGHKLRSAFGDAVIESPDEPAYFVGLGSIGVRVEVEPVGADDAVIAAYSWIAQGLRVTAELALDLVQRNAELRFGALSVDGEGAIILGDALFADGASEKVLARLVTVLAATAEALDAELRERFAGVR